MGILGLHRDGLAGLAAAATPEIPAEVRAMAEARVEARAARTGRLRTNSAIGSGRPDSWWRTAPKESS